MGYQVTTVTPANMAPMAAAALPSMMILPCGCVHRARPHSGSCLVSVLTA